jgi:hypothetical protein
MVDLVEVVALTHSSVDLVGLVALTHSSVDFVELAGSVEDYIHKCLCM